MYRMDGGCMRLSVHTYVSASGKAPLGRLGSWLSVVWDVTCPDTMAHNMDHSLQGNVELHITTDGQSEVFTYSIYSTVVRSTVKYKTQWTDSLYYVHMCDRCTVDKPSCVQ